MSDIDNLLNRSIEIESLLRQLRDRDSLEARALLGEKIDVYLDAVKAYLSTPAAVEAAKADETETQDNEEPAEAHAAGGSDREAAAPEICETAPAPKARPLAESRPRDHAARSLAKAFTLNERFRFIREVFGGDAVDFENTLHVLEDSDTPDEVADYIYNEMMLDPSDRAVADFVELVQNHIRN